MNPYMLAELENIAQAGNLPLFTALDKLANTLSGPTIKPPSTTGATSMAGMSVHCDKCFHEIQQEGVKQCPKCGNAIKALRDIKSGPTSQEKTPGESGETGAEASVNEDLASGTDGEKHAGIPPLLMKLRGAAALGGGAYVGIKGAKAMKGLLGQGKEKRARASHLANPVLNLSRRGHKVSSVTDFRKKFKGMTRKFTSRDVSLAR